jgi:hypothetical protein
MTPHSRGAILASGSCNSVALGNQRAQGVPGARPHPQSSWAEKKNAHKSSGRAEVARHSLRNGSTAAPHSPWSTGLASLHRGWISAFRPQGRNRNLHSLDPSVGGSGPRGLTVRIGYASPAHLCVHRSPHHESWRSRNALRSRRGMARLKAHVPNFGKTNIFTRTA